jgi:hypothetical protein
LTGEVERLTAEKDALATALTNAATAAPATTDSSSPDVETLKQEWATEKQSLVTARDNAQTQMKVNHLSCIFFHPLTMSQSVQQHAQKMAIAARNEKAEHVCSIVLFYCGR